MIEAERMFGVLASALRRSASVVMVPCDQDGNPVSAAVDVTQLLEFDGEGVIKLKAPARFDHVDAGVGRRAVAVTMIAGEARIGQVALYPELPLTKGVEFVELSCLMVSQAA